MPDLDLEPKSYRWTSGPRHWRKAARARKIRDGRLLDSAWFRLAGYAAGIWMGVVIGSAKFLFAPAPLWPVVFLSLTPILVWAATMIWDDTA